MEASLIFVLARMWGLRAGGVAVMVDHVRHVSGEAAFDPDAQIEHGADHIERLAVFGCEVVRSLHEQDLARDDGGASR